MKLTLTDGSGRTFDTATAETFNEDSVWENGQAISVATRQPDRHERLHCVHRRWVLERWSGEDRPEATREVVVIPAEAAHRWLIANHHPVPA